MKEKRWRMHSASPIALIYREKPAEEAEVDTDKVAP